MAKNKKPETIFPLDGSPENLMLLKSIKQQNKEAFKPEDYHPVNFYAFTITSYREGDRSFSVTPLSEVGVMRVLGDHIDVEKLRNTPSEYIVQTMDDGDVVERHIVTGDQDYVFDQVESLFDRYGGRFQMDRLKGNMVKTEALKSFQSLVENQHEKLGWIKEMQPRLRI